MTHNRELDANTTTPQLRLSSAELRREISHRNLLRAEAIAHETTIGETPSILYHDTQGSHGNFIAAAYRRILASPDWHRRLAKAYTASSRVPRPRDRDRRELDCANSSDALLMNVFCYPGVTCRQQICSMLGIARGSRPQFGVKARVPTLRGGSDRSEIDMVVDNLFVEAKLTEGDFQRAPSNLLDRYSRFEAVFDIEKLPQANGSFRSYQLIRGVLAADHHGMRLAVVCDGRREDLLEAWIRVAAAVKCSELRTRLAVLTWQELAAGVSRKLQCFLAEKYGIGTQSC